MAKMKGFKKVYCFITPHSFRSCRKMVLKKNERTEERKKERKKGKKMEEVKSDTEREREGIFFLIEDF